MKTKHIQYSASALAFLGVSTLQGQILTNPEPDMRITNIAPYNHSDSLTIDINGNGIDDITLRYNKTYSYDLVDVCIFGDVTAVVGSDFFGEFAEGFDYGSLISPYLDWNENDVFKIYHLITVAWYSGCDAGITSIGGETVYIGLKLNIEDSTHYGWLRLSSHDIGVNECYIGPGVPISVYEYAYNPIPDSSIVCNSGTVSRNFNLKLGNFNDADQFDEFGFTRPNYIGYDGYKLRIYAMDNPGELLSFNVDAALALGAESYAEFSLDYGGGGAFITHHLPDTLLTISGSAFNPENDYIFVYMVIPPPGDTSILTLSSPTKWTHVTDERCFNNGDIYITIIDETAGVSGVQIQFIDAEVEVWDVLYRVALSPDPIEYLDIESITDPLSYIDVIGTGASEYTITLDGIEKDIFGDLLVAGESYHPVIISPADGYYYDVGCYFAEHYFILPETVEITELQSSGITISHVQIGATLVLNINGDLNEIQNVSLELLNSQGASLGIFPIQDNSLEINLNKLASGYYYVRLTSEQTVVAKQMIYIQ